MAAQSNANLEKYALFKCLCGVWKLDSSALTVGQIEAPVQFLALEILCHFARTDKSNSYFEFVKTLRLFVWTHNNNKSLCFCKIMNANSKQKMRFLPSRSLRT